MSIGGARLPLRSASHLGFLKAAEEPPPKKKARAAPAPAPEVLFVPSDEYVGSTPGAVFKLGDQGQGYYTDTGFGTLSESRSRCRNLPVDVCAGADGDGDSSEDEDDEDAYVTWMGCSLVYIFLTTAFYDKLSKKLLGPHHSLDLSDPEVVDLVFEAATSGECKVVGDDEFRMNTCGPDFYHVPDVENGSE